MMKKITTMKMMMRIINLYKLTKSRKMQARMNNAPDLPWINPMFSKMLHTALPQKGVMYDVAFIIRAKPYGRMDLVAFNQIRSGAIHLN